MKIKFLKYQYNYFDYYRKKLDVYVYYEKYNYYNYFDIETISLTLYIAHYRKYN